MVRFQRISESESVSAVSTLSHGERRWRLRPTSWSLKQECSMMCSSSHRSSIHTGRCTVGVWECINTQLYMFVYLSTCWVNDCMHGMAWHGMGLDRCPRSSWGFMRGARSTSSGSHWKRMTTATSTLKGQRTLFIRLSVYFIVCVRVCIPCSIFNACISISLTTTYLTSSLLIQHSCSHGW